jgi:hypothetical protein
MDSVNRIDVKTFETSFDILVLCIATSSTIFFMIHESESDRARQTAERIKKNWGQDLGVFEVESANRFGEIVVVIGCISKEDRERIERAIIREKNDVPFYFSYPIWYIGGLVPGSTEKFVNMLRDPKNVTYGTKEWDAKEKIQKELVLRDEGIWASWNQVQRRKFISDWIKKERKRIKGYANCGDKFLLPD